MHTVFIKKKLFLWLSIFLIALVAVSLIAICAITGCRGFLEKSSYSPSLQRSAPVDSVTRVTGVSSVMTNQNVAVSRTAHRSNVLVHGTDRRHDAQSWRTYEISEGTVPTQTQTADLLLSMIPEHPEEPVLKTGEQWEELASITAHPQKWSGAAGLAESALEIVQRTGVVLFTVINDAYLEFAASWLCNTGPMEGLHQHVLFLATDNPTAARLRALSPRVTVVSLHADRFSGGQVYSHAGYVRLMAERTRRILFLLELGVPLLLFEVDCVWLSNPLPDLLSQGKAVDIVATRVENRTAGGFLLLNPTLHTLTLWRQLTTKMDELFKELENRSDSTVISWRLNDQEFLSDLIKEGSGGVRVSHLPEDLYPDGRWYYQPAEERRGGVRPVIINNNFVRGNSAKRSRAKQFGHWFLTEDSSEGRGFACNASAVKTVIPIP